jgi:prephenate dehydratase
VSRVQEFSRIAFQGEPGAFSEEAAVRLLGDAVETVPRPSFDALFAAIDAGAADAILAPIENSLAGTIVPVCDLLWSCRHTIHAEAIHPIRMCLIGAPGATLQSIRSVQSHPAALAQCENYFRAHARVHKVAAEDTAGSVREVMQQRDPVRAAIASRRAAERYGATVLCAGIDDNALNYTRFLLLAPQAATQRGANKMTLLVRLGHRPGSLHRALEVFARRNMNLLKIESRPLHGSPWHYRFFLDVETPPVAELVQATLRDLEKHTEEVRLLGWYRAAATPGQVAAPAISDACPAEVAR